MREKCKRGLQRGGKKKHCSEKIHVLEPGGKREKRGGEGDRLASLTIPDLQEGSVW